MNQFRCVLQALVIFATLSFSGFNLAAETVKFEGVELPTLVQLKSSTPTELKSVSYALRKKKVFAILPVSIYVAHFLAADPTKLNKTPDGILNSLKTAGPVQMRLILKRGLSGSDISGSFKEALKKNGVDFGAADTSGFQGLPELMQEIDKVKSVKEGDVFSLTADWSGGMTQIWVESPGAEPKSISANDQSLQKLFSIWFGEPVDDKMKDLKSRLLE